MVSACAIVSYSVMLHAIVRVGSGGLAFQVHNVHVSCCFEGAFCSTVQYAQSSWGNWQTMIREPWLQTLTCCNMHACKAWHFWLQ